MRLATWNINGLRARFDYLCHWLDARQPDVVGLQELKLEDEKFPHAELEAVGYTAVTHGQKAWNGVAILSKEPMTVEQRGLPGQDDFGARLITSTVSDISFTTVYCPNGKHLGHDDFPRKLAWFESLVAHLDEAHDPERPTILCGDFNICPEALDSFDEAGRKGSIFHTDEERKRYKRLLAWGMEDLFRVLHPDTQAFSWWDYRGGSFHRGLGLRIDFVLGTVPIVERLESAEIDRDYRKKKKDGLTASDHAPVIVDLDW